MGAKQFSRPLPLSSQSTLRVDSAGKTLAQMSFRDLWRLTNEPRSFNPGQVRIACAVLGITFGVIAVVFYRPGHPLALAMRGVLVFYALVGFTTARRMTWDGLRLFALGAGLLLPLEGLYATFLPRDPLFNLALLGMATFFPFVFLLTGRDIVIAAVALTACHLTVLAFAAPPNVDLSAVAAVLGGSVAAGMAVGMILKISMAGTQASMRWWRSACDRERRLRELNQLAASNTELVDLLPRFAHSFADSIEGSRCLLFLADAEGVYRTAACAGVRPDRSAWLIGKLLPSGLATFLSPVLNAGEEIVRSGCSVGERADICHDFPDDLFGPLVVALPIRVDDRVDGAIVLTSPAEHGLETDDLLLLRSMASQVGVAIGKARLVEQLRDALNAKSEFVNTMSHELRSPLNVVIGYADMFLDGGVDAKFVGARIRDSGLELLQLVENSLTVARLGTGKLKLNVEEFSLQRLLTEVAEAVRSLPEGRKGIEVEWHTDPGLSRVELDRLKLKEILQNLVSNGLKYTDEGRVIVRVRRDGDQLHIEVEDTGRGIPAEAQARIFEMFERVETVNDTPPPGVGLGLYIVKNLVDLMNGTIHLVSRPDEGSCFTVRLAVRLDPTVAEGRSARRGAPRPPAIGYVS
jgi:signal transduction histidine kinase